MSSFSEIDVAEVETRADEMLGQVSGNEYDLLLSKLAGARGNRVFSFFGIEAPQRAAEALLAVQKAGGKAKGTGGVTATLEKKKRKKGGSGPGGGKRSKLLDIRKCSVKFQHMRLRWSTHHNTIYIGWPNRRFRFS